MLIIENSVFANNSILCNNKEFKFTDETGSQILAGIDKSNISVSASNIKH